MAGLPLDWVRYSLAIGDVAIGAARPRTRTVHVPGPFCILSSFLTAVQILR
jgi:hypothetical protein